MPDEITALVARLRQKPATDVGYGFTGVLLTVVEQTEIVAALERLAWEPPPLWHHAVQECNAAHQALDGLGAPKTARVRRVRGPDGEQEITVGLAERIKAALAAAQGEWETCDKCRRRVPRTMIAVELNNGAPIDDPAGCQWCVVCHGQRALAVAQGEVARLTQDRDCYKAAQAREYDYRTDDRLKREQAEARAERLEATLREYGRHAEGCSAGVGGSRYRCRCGWTNTEAALTGEEPAPTEPASITDWKRRQAICPDALQPGGPVCPHCGGPRGPSGIDGGSWVHFPDRRGEEPTP